MTESVSSTIINVTWEEVPPIDQNGIIVTYEVCYEPLETFDGILMKEIANTSELFYRISGLEEFVEYNISIRAYTSEGPGPYSDTVEEMTQTDSMFCYHIKYMTELLYLSTCGLYCRATYCSLKYNI